MNPLETATLDELMDEIKRRTIAGLIVVSGQDPKDRNKFGSTFWGSSMWTISACRMMASRALKELEDQEPEEDDALEP